MQSKKQFDCEVSKKECVDYFVEYFNKDLQAKIIETFTDCKKFIARLVDIQHDTVLEICSITTYSSQCRGWL